MKIKDLRDVLVGFAGETRKLIREITNPLDDRVASLSNRVAELEAKLAKYEGRES